MEDSLIKVIRYDSNQEHTNGLIQIDGANEGFTLEDEGRTIKVFGETRVPDGVYKVALRAEGGTHVRYKAKFNDRSSRHFMDDDWHQGMLCVHNQEHWKLANAGMSFQYILIHIGNDDDDTAGCLLVGLTAESEKNMIGKSTDAYKKIYPIIRDAVRESKDGYVYIEYKTIG